MAQGFRFSEDPNPKLVLPVTMEYAFEHKDLSNLLITAFEGGSNDWYWIERFKQPRAMPIWVQREDTAKYRHAWYPLTMDGGVVVSDRTAEAENVDGPMFLSRSDPAFKEWLVANVKPTKVKLLNLPAVVNGLKIMAQKHPRHFRDFVEDNVDAITGDVFLQCAVLGDIVYG